MRLTEADIPLDELPYVEELMIPGHFLQKVATSLGFAGNLSDESTDAAAQPMSVR